MADDLEVVFGDRIVRLDGTVVECFGLGGFFAPDRSREAPHGRMTCVSG